MLRRVTAPLADRTNKNRMAFLLTPEANLMRFFLHYTRRPVRTHVRSSGFSLRWIRILDEVFDFTLLTYWLPLYDCFLGVSTLHRLSSWPYCGTCRIFSRHEDQPWPDLLHVKQVNLGFLYSSLDTLSHGVAFLIHVLCILLHTPSSLQEGAKVNASWSVSSLIASNCFDGS